LRWRAKPPANVLHPCLDAKRHQANSSSPFFALLFPHFFLFQEDFKRPVASAFLSPRVCQRSTPPRPPRLCRSADNSPPSPIFSAAAVSFSVPAASSVLLHACAFPPRFSLFPQTPPPADPGCAVRLSPTPHHPAAPATLRPFQTAPSPARLFSATSPRA